MKTQRYQILFGLILIVILAIGGYYVFAKRSVSSPDQMKKAASTSSTSTTEKNDIAGEAAIQNPVIKTANETEWIRYADERGFGFEVPSNWKREDTYNFSYASSDSAQRMRASVEVLPIGNLRVGEDPSAEIMYDSSKKEWVSISCTDFNMSTYCREAKNVTTKVVASNATVGGIQAYAFLHQSPAVYIVPINSKYGLKIMISPAINGLNPTLQKILSSFKFNEPAN